MKSVLRWRNALALALVLARAATEGVAAWVDPDGYRKFVAATRAKFEAALGSEAP